MLDLTCGPSQRGFPANPSQDSLSLSGSLHSWNPETAEGLSDLEEDSDQLCGTGLDDSVVEEREGEEQNRERLLQKDLCADGITEKCEDKEEEQKKNGSSLPQEPVEDGVTGVGMEDRGLKGNDRVTDGDQTTEGAEEKDEEQEEAADSSVAVAELGETSQFNPQSVTDPQQDNRAEDASAAKATPTNSPKILSAAAHFRVPPSGIRVKTWAMEPAKREGLECPDEEVLSPVKVSELKKRFEA